MTRDQSLEAADRVIAFLDDCDQNDIEAGIAIVMVCWSDAHRNEFRQHLANAIRTSGDNAT